MPHPVIVLLAAVLLLGFIARRVLPARTVVQHLEVRRLSDLAFMRHALTALHSGPAAEPCIGIDSIQHQRTRQQSDPYR